MKRLLAFTTALLLLSAFFICGCPGRSSPSSGSSAPVVIKMATTTSTENTGLLDVMLPAFEKRTGITVHAVAVGTGKAVKLARNADVDVILVHAPDAEVKFVEEGFGRDRTKLFYNDFVIVGPKDDPAGAAGAQKASAAFKKIAESSSAFVSRGDDSGTHKKELAIWKETGIQPEGPWYIETGQGMGTTLTIADEKQACCLVDRGTYLAFRKKIDLVVICEGDPLLYNPYSIIAVNPERHPHAKYKETKEFIDWMTSPEAKNLIRNFTREGEVLFNLYD